MFASTKLMLWGERNKVPKAGGRTVKDWPVEGTALHKRGTSAEEWEAAQAASAAPILDGSRGVPVSGRQARD